jgi:hypothetical protein
MKIVEAFQREGYLEIRIEGHVTQSKIEDLLRSLASLIQERKSTRVLADVLLVTGTPSTLDLYTVGSGLARSLPPSVRLSMLATRAMTDPQKLGPVIAQNRGLAADIFNDRDEAIRWLMEEPGGP